VSEALTAAQRMATTIDTHDWSGLAGLLHPQFRCRYVHTGEEFDGRNWVRLNAEYPGFERFIVEDTIGVGSRCVIRQKSPLAPTEFARSSRWPASSRPSMG